MKKYLVVLFLACGSPVELEVSPEPAAPTPSSPTMEVMPAVMQVAVARQAASVDPCSLVDGRQHTGVIFTAMQINNADPRCPVGRYMAQGTSSTDPDGALPFHNQRCGCCPATFTSTTRPLADGGTEAVCHVTSSCQVCFNGGNSQMSCDLWFEESGKFTGTQESVSDGQLCPYVKVGLNNTGRPFP